MLLVSHGIIQPRQVDTNNSKDAKSSSNSYYSHSNGGNHQRVAPHLIPILEIIGLQHLRARCL